MSLLKLVANWHPVPAAVLKQRCLLLVPQQVCVLHAGLRLHVVPLPILLRVVQAPASPAVAAAARLPVLAIEGVEAEDSSKRKQLGGACCARQGWRRGGQPAIWLLQPVMLVKVLQQR